MTEPDKTDEQVLEDLRSALEAADPVPDDVLEMAKASFTWRTIDAELAELVFDSATDEVVGVRSGGEGERQLTFRAPAVEIEVLMSAEGRRLTGQLVPPQKATVELVAGDTTLEAEADDLGTFSFENVPSGPVSLRCTLEDGETTISTDWTIL